MNAATLSPSRSAAILCGLLAFAVSLLGAPHQVVTGIQTATTSGAMIHGHCGCIVKDGSNFYWFGVFKSNGAFDAIKCYKSTDLANWTFDKDVLTSASTGSCNIERPRVVMNPHAAPGAANRFVMWMHYENASDYSLAQCATAQCSTANGNYTFLRHFRPLANLYTESCDGLNNPGYMSRDCTLFVDNDANQTAYFVSTSRCNHDVNIYQLNNDYLSCVNQAPTVAIANQNREAPALFKRNGVYFLLTSYTGGWNPNQQKYTTTTASSPLSGWAPTLTNVGDGTCYGSQTTWVLPISGSGGTSYLFMGDRWPQSWTGGSNSSNDGRYVWMPIAFPDNTHMNLVQSDALTIDTAAGSIAGGMYDFVFTNVDSTFVMEVPGNSTTAGTQLDQWPNNGGANQQWSEAYDGNGWFTFTNVHSNLLMDVVNGSTAAGAALEQNNLDTGDPDKQKWTIVDLGGGAYKLKNKKSGKLAEEPQLGQPKFTTLDQDLDGGGNNQHWTIQLK